VRGLDAWRTLARNIDTLRIEWQEGGREEGGICHCGELQVQDSAQQLRKVEASIIAGSDFVQKIEASLATEVNPASMFNAVAVDEDLLAAKEAELRSLCLLYSDCTALECLTQTADSAYMLCRILLRRQTEAKYRVQARTASTSQRRSLLTQTALLPGIVSFLRGVMALLEVFTATPSTPIGVKFATSCMGIVGKIEREVQKQGLADAIKAATQFAASKAVKSYRKALQRQAES